MKLRHCGFKLRLTVIPTSSDVGLSAVLLNRARSAANEHADLSKLLAENFDTKIAKRVGELTPVTKALREWENTNNVGFDPGRRLQYFELTLESPGLTRLSRN